MATRGNVEECSFGENDEASDGTLRERTLTVLARDSGRTGIVISALFVSPDGRVENL
jgi:hypothetical protein